MNIKFKQLTMDQMPSSAVPVAKGLKVIDHPAVTEDSTPSISMYFIDTDKIYQFDIETNNEPVSLSSIVNEILYQLFSDKIDDVTVEEKTDIVRAVNISAGQLAENAKFDPTNKVFYHMLDGSVIYNSMDSINWDNNIEHIDDLSRTTDNIRAMIRILLCDKMFTPTATKENPEPAPIPAEIYVMGEIERFSEHNHFDVDYSIFDNDIVPTRGILIAKLIDMLTVYSEIIMVTNMMKMRREMFAQNTEDETPIDATTAEDITPEIVNEGD